LALGHLRGAKTDMTAPFATSGLFLLDSLNT